MTADADVVPNCPQCGFGECWSVEIQGSYDGVLLFECPSCGHLWPRYPAGTRLHRVGLECIAARKAATR